MFSANTIQGEAALGCNARSLGAGRISDILRDLVHGVVSEGTSDQIRIGAAGTTEREEDTGESFNQGMLQYLRKLHEANKQRHQVRQQSNATPQRPANILES